MLLEKKVSENREGGYSSGGSAHSPPLTDWPELVEGTEGKVEYVVNQPVAS